MKTRFFVIFLLTSYFAYSQETNPDHVAQLKQYEQKRVQVIEEISPTVVCVFGNQPGGGGSGFLFHEQGYLLTNFHVVQPVGLTGLGGINDGKLYPMTVYGIDPGGDVALAKLNEGKFKAASIGNSDKVRVGDFCMALGNPFLLAEDYTPTVTFGIVSGTHRYQEGMGRALIYGDCIQIDSSINPGNSGGPLFNMKGEVIGINGRGSFEERGRVNVGLGYAISMNQVLNFLPDLLATKTCLHATLNAIFKDTRDGVICSKINTSSKIYEQGMRLGDQLISFEGVKIKNANQYTNLITLYPANWPATVVFKRGQEVMETVVRLEDLPYQQVKPSEEAPKPPALPIKINKPTWAKPGDIRDLELNQKEASRLVDESAKLFALPAEKKPFTVQYGDQLFEITYQNNLINVKNHEGVIVSYDWEKDIMLLDDKDMPDEDRVKWFEVMNPFLCLYIIHSIKAKDKNEDLILVGSDKANGERAFLLELNANETLSYQIWLSVINKDYQFNHQILKVSAKLNQKNSDYGYLFQWKTLDEKWHLEEVNACYGLNEKQYLSIKVKQP